MLVLAPARATSETRLEPGWRLQQEIGQSACPHAVEKESLKLKELEHVPIDKVEQLF